MASGSILSSIASADMWNYVTKGGARSTDLNPARFHMLPVKKIRFHLFVNKPHIMKDALSRKE